MKRPSRLVLLLSAGALALGLAVAASTAALATTNPPGGTAWAELYNPLAGTAKDTFPVCLDVTNGSKSSGSGIQMYHCHGYDGKGGPQRWTFLRMSNGSYEIFNQANKLCLTPDPRADAVKLDVFMVQEPCGPFAGQEWKMTDAVGHPGYFNLRNDTYPNRCLWAGGGEHRDHALVMLVKCSAEALQVWALG